MDPKPGPASLMDTISIVLNATRLHATHRQPVLTTGGSPWLNCHDPLNTTCDAAEVHKWRTAFETLRDDLAAANNIRGANVSIGTVHFDQEAFGWAPVWIGTASQKIIDAVGRKNELIFNVTKEVFPDAEVLYYDYGASHWLPSTNLQNGCPSRFRAAEHFVD